MIQKIEEITQRITKILRYILASIAAILTLTFYLWMCISGKTENGEPLWVVHYVVIGIVVSLCPAIVIISLLKPELLIRILNKFKCTTKNTNSTTVSKEAKKIARVTEEFISQTKKEVVGESAARTEEIKAEEERIARKLAENELLENFIDITSEDEKCGYEKGFLEYLNNVDKENDS